MKKVEDRYHKIETMDMNLGNVSNSIKIKKDFLLMGMYIKRFNTRITALLVYLELPGWVIADPWTSVMLFFICVGNTNRK